MPLAPAPPCIVPLCRRCATPGSPRCAVHAQQRRCAQLDADHARTMSDSFYQSRPWRRFRAQVLTEQPVCAEPSCRAPALDVAHVIPRRERPDLALERTNVRGLCHRHHASETARRESWHTHDVDPRRRL
jgi:5-methylcytosine-specific restriction endonuclease McrA